MLQTLVRKAILEGKSGSIFVSIESNEGSRSCTYDRLKNFKSVCQLPSDININLDTGELTPMNLKGWEVIEGIHAESPLCEEFPGCSYKLQVLLTPAAHSTRFRGWIDVEHNYLEIRKEQFRVEQARREEGFGVRR